MPVKSEVSSAQLSALEEALSYKFRKRALLRQALTHRSHTNEASHRDEENNERLEFLGDSVLDLVLSHLLYEQRPNFSEGNLSRSLASLINERSLAALARKIDLGSYLILGRGEVRTKGRNKNSILADAFEALMAAVYIDGGYRNASRVVAHHFDELLSHDFELTDYKTRLQEITQKLYGRPPTYKVIKQSGKEHQRVFEVSVSLNGEKIASGQGTSKKQAEQSAAQQALKSYDGTQKKKKKKSVKAKPSR